MRAQIEAIVDELKLLKGRGVNAVFLEKQTMHALREATAGQQTTGSVEAVQVNEPAPAKRSTLNYKREPAPLIDLNTVASPEAKAPAKKAAAKKKEKKHITAPIPDPEPFTLPEGDKQTQWDWLRERVLQDEVCNAHVRTENGKKVVFGVGNLEADIFFCGEAPGAEEEVKAEPFVGPAGQLLTKIIGAMGLSREQVYISNIMNWRPEMPTPYGNRKPYPEEMAYCLPYLQAQVQIVKPKIIVALGGTAIDGLLGEDPSRRVTKIRGNWFSYSDTPMMVTFHPSYLLHNNTMRTKRLVWEDMLKVMERLEIPISAKQRAFFAQ